jgi:hypothetical protein
MTETLSKMIKRLSSLRPKLTFRSRPKRSSTSSTTTPRTSDSTQATHGGRTPRLLSTKVSREARVAKSTRFPEDDIILVREISDLIALNTASPKYVLARIDALPSDLSDWHRKALLKAAREAVEVAYSAFDRARSAGREKMPEDAAFERMSRLPFADVRDFETYTFEVGITARELKESVLGFGILEVALFHSKGAENYIRDISSRTKWGGTVAQDKEIWWAVERKCMYWAAVAMMEARLEARVDDVSPDRGSGTARKTGIADKTSQEGGTKRANRAAGAETTGTA